MENLVSFKDGMMRKIEEMTRKLGSSLDWKREVLWSECKGQKGGLGTSPYGPRV